MGWGEPHGPGLDTVDSVIKAYYEPAIRVQIAGVAYAPDSVWLAMFPPRPPYDPTADGIPLAWSPYVPGETDWMDE